MNPVTPLTMRHILQFDDLETLFDLLNTSMEGYNLGHELRELVDYQTNKSLMHQLQWDNNDHLYLQLFCNMYHFLMRENAVSSIPEENDLDIVTTLFSAFIPNFFTQIANQDFTFKNYKIHFAKD